MNDYVLGPSILLPVAASEGARLWYSSRLDGSDPHAILEFGGPAHRQIPLVRVHSACFTGDVLGSCRCDCGEQLVLAKKTLSAAGHGLLVYAFAHEGRGIGLQEKLQAYLLQDGGYDTYEANRQLGYMDDARDYTGAAAALRLLGADVVDLLTSNPEKVRALIALGIDIRSVSALDVQPCPGNAGYLKAKRQRAARWPSQADDPAHASTAAVALPTRTRVG